MPLQCSGLKLPTGGHFFPITDPERGSSLGQARPIWVEVVVARAARSWPNSAVGVLHELQFAVAFVVGQACLSALTRPRTWLQVAAPPAVSANEHSAFAMRN